MTGRRRKIAIGATVLAALLAGEATIAAAGKVESEEDNQAHIIRSQFLAGGYLAPEALPDSLVINPPPPQAGSVAETRDIEASREGLGLQGTPRFALAAIDAAMINPDGSSVFSCSAGFRISRGDTPKIDALLKRAARDLALSSYPTKQCYRRERPFMSNGQPTCTPDHEAMLRKDGSYPSGHSAIGYGWSLILAELVPDRAAQIVARGIAFGDSRRICNVHWLSDVEQGRAIAAAVVARLHADPQFSADLEAARAEARKRLAKPVIADCALEEASLAGHSGLRQ
ncbi:MAG: phosphatase PAP2 family protein [Novosphingobium sp.]|nr:phosphatase PAP2 family protein [Novosphingobium sp.]